MLKGSLALVRVGGGFENLEKYIVDHKEEEIAQIYKQMEDEGKSYDDVVIGHLGRLKADQKVIDKYFKRSKKKRELEEETKQ